MKTPPFLQSKWQQLFGPAKQPAADKPTEELTKWEEEKAKKIKEACDILKNTTPQSTKEKVLIDLYSELQSQEQLSYASKILQRKIDDYPAATERLRIKDYQQLARFTYKDTSLPSAVKFDTALKILSDNCNLFKAPDTETLGLAGSIYKRKFYFDSQFKNLEFSLYYYKRGYQNWLKWLAGKTDILEDNEGLNDNGFTGINYAFVSELVGIKKLEQWQDLGDFDLAVFDYFKTAHNVRQDILDAIAGLENEIEKWKTDGWIAAIKAEAHFGLCNYDKAIPYIVQARDVLKSQRWMLSTFGQQMLSQAQSQLFLFKYGIGTNLSAAVKMELKKAAEGISEDQINECLKPLISADATVVATGAAAFVLPRFGKAGLALSGGGFRASLFHIGVLAALAEEDKLKNIEVISCVSGGSIIGAYYYLGLKNLLENNADKDITSGMYIALVKDIEKGFLEGVQQNLRARIFTNFWSNLKMLSDAKNYSRTNRIGELYENFLYNKIFSSRDCSTGKVTTSQSICMRDLLIKPFGQCDFVIQHDNWRRVNRIPQLVLNATSVNTGHNFQFTASWMGEPPDIQLSNIDVKPRLRRMYYYEAKEERYQKFKLGYAVGASSCVPVIFDPLPLYGLYQNVDLQLIDGGLHDNQGIASLIDQECTTFIISDASGQMRTDDDPTYGPASVFYRADSILQERLRELQFTDVLARNNSGQIVPLSKMHLKKDLKRNDIDWVGCDDKEPKEERPDPTSYGVPTDIEEKLSNLRTDLDSFNDTEAYGLMYAGYRQTKAEYGQPIPPDQPITGDWNFANFFNQLSPAQIEKTTAKLAIGENLLFKVLLIYKGAKYIPRVLGLILLVTLLHHCYCSPGSASYRSCAIIVSVIIVAFILGKGISYLGVHFKPLEKLMVFFKMILMLLPALLIWLLSNIALYTLNAVYNRMGKI